MTLSQMRKAVFAQKPGFKAVLSRYGGLSLARYYRRLGADYTPSAVPRSRQKELCAVIVKKTKIILGKQVADAMTRYLKQRYIVSTAAHHDFATHPFFANYLIAAGYANTQAGIPIVPVLSCAGISLNNSSFPRGLLIHDKTGNQRRIHLVSLKSRHQTVYNHPVYTKQALANAHHELRGFHLDANQHQKALTLLHDALDQKTASTSLCNQITGAVHALYRQLPGWEKTHVVYLAQEEIATTLLTKYHLSKKTPIGQILFDSNVRNAFLKAFDGIIGAHSLKNKSGTHLFWALTSQGRVALAVVGATLISTDGTIKIPLTKTAIARALNSKRIMPAMSLTLPLLSFYYGLACAGGFSQVGYLTEMKRAYLSVLSAINAPAQEIAIARAVPTDLFAGEFVLATLTPHKAPATTLDIITLPHTFTESALKKLLKETTLSKATDGIMPELYNIIAPK